MQDTLRLRSGHLLSVFIVIFALPIGNGCDTSSRQRFTLESFGPRKAAASTPPVPVPELLRCPPAGSPMLKSSAPATGHHRVVLTWNASAQSVHPTDNAAGYCLYRSKKKDVAAKNAICSECEQINSVPIVGTGCVDDLVQDRTLYHYVVTAISLGGMSSASSNEIPVKIPDNKQNLASLAAPPYPLCRAPASSK